MCVLPFKFTSLDFYAESFHGSETTALCRIFGSFCFRLFARKWEIHLASLVKVRRCCRFAGEKFFLCAPLSEEKHVTYEELSSVPPIPQLARAKINRIDFLLFHEFFSRLGSLKI